MGDSHSTIRQDSPLLSFLIEPTVMCSMGGMTLHIYGTVSETVLCQTQWEPHPVPLCCYSESSAFFSSRAEASVSCVLYNAGIFFYGLVLRDGSMIGKSHLHKGATC